MSFLGGDTNLYSQAVCCLRALGFCQCNRWKMVPQYNFNLNLLWYTALLNLNLFWFTAIFQFISSWCFLLTSLYYRQGISSFILLLSTCPSSQEFMSESHRWLMLTLLWLHNSCPLQGQSPVEYYDYSSYLPPPPFLKLMLVKIYFIWGDFHSVLFYTIWVNYCFMHQQLIQFNCLLCWLLCSLLFLATFFKVR